MKLLLNKFISFFKKKVILNETQGYNRNINKLITFIFRNMTIFQTSQNGIEDKQSGTEGVIIIIKIKRERERERERVCGEK